MKENLVLSGLHLIVSGPRPVMPPSAKIASIVSGSFAESSGVVDWAAAHGTSRKRAYVQRTSRFMRKTPGKRVAISRVEKCTPSGRDDAWEAVVAGSASIGKMSEFAC